MAVDAPTCAARIVIRGWSLLGGRLVVCCDSMREAGADNSKLFSRGAIWLDSLKSSEKMGHELRCSEEMRPMEEHSRPTLKSCC